MAEMIPAERQLCLTLVDQVIENIKKDHPRAEFDVTGLDSSGAEHCRICIRRRQSAVKQRPANGRGRPRKGPRGDHGVPDRLGRLGF